MYQFTYISQELSITGNAPFYCPNFYRGIRTFKVDHNRNGSFPFSLSPPHPQSFSFSCFRTARRKKKASGASDTNPTGVRRSWKSGLIFPNPHSPHFPRQPGLWQIGRLPGMVTAASSRTQRTGKTSFEITWWWWCLFQGEIVTFINSTFFKWKCTLSSTFMVEPVTKDEHFAY